MFTIYDRLAIFHKICSTTSYTIMEPQDETVFKKPEEPRPKTPTPYEEDSERPAKVRKVYGEKPEKMMSVLRKKQSNSFLGNMVPFTMRDLLQMSFGGKVTFWYQRRITTQSF